MQFSHGGINYEIRKDSNVEIISSPGASGDIVIPKSVVYQRRKYVIVGISPNAFSHNKGINSIEFSDDSKVTFIEKEAFSDSSITFFAAPPSLNTICTKAFHSCVKLEKVTFTEDSNLEIIDNSAFAYSGLKSIEIPPQIQQIGVNAFSHCDKLCFIDFAPDSNLNTISQSAFSFCSKLTNISIPPHVQSIGSSAFSYCTSLKSIYFTKDSEISTMDYGVFSMVPLESISIPPLLNNYNRYFKDFKTISSLELFFDDIVINRQLYTDFPNLKELFLPDARTVRVESGSGNFKIIINRKVALSGQGIKEHTTAYTDSYKRPRSLSENKKSSSSIKIAPSGSESSITSGKKEVAGPKSVPKRTAFDTLPVKKKLSPPNELETRIHELEQQLKAKTKEIEELQTALKEERTNHKITQRKLENLIENEKKTGEDKTSFKMDSVKFLSVDDVKHYKKEKKIGRGATSKVVKVSTSKVEFYALKILNIELCSVEKKHKKKGYESDSDYDDDDFEIDFEKVKRFFSEYELISQLEHPNIIKTFGFCNGDQSHEPSILFEFCPYNLSSYIKKNDVEDYELIRIIYEICDAMKYIHKNGIIHRDLKPENILLDSDKKVKISDFGISKLVTPGMQSESYTKGLGTIGYMAPELLGNGSYDEKVDVYAFAFVLFFILNDGELPSTNLINISKGIMPQIPKSINKISQSLIKKCWSYNSIDRPSFDQIIGIMAKYKFALIDGVDQRKVASILRK